MRHFATLAGSRAFYSRQTPYLRDCRWNSFKPKYMRNLRYFVVTHCHRHGATTGLIIGEERQKKPSEAEAVKLLKLNFEPDQEEFIHVTEEKPVFMTKSCPKRGMSGEQRSRLIAKWANRLYDITASWRGPIGMQLAYLFAAMASGNHVALNRKSALVRLLQDADVSSSDPIWRFIRIEE
jgi:hypothetical protein